MAAASSGTFTYRFSYVLGFCDSAVVEIRGPPAVFEIAGGVVNFSLGIKNYKLRLTHILTW